MSEPKSFSTKRVLPWLIGVCLLGFAGFVAVGAYETIAGVPIFPTATPTATPTPALPPGGAVKLANHNNDSVTVWYIGDSCVLGNALGKVPSGSAAFTMEDACYHLEDQSYYYRVELANGSVGWVRAENVIPADQYKPPTATSTQKPAPTPRAVPTKQTSLRWAGVYIGMPADDVLKIHPESEAVTGPVAVGADSEGQIVKWTYPGAFLILARREGKGTDSLGNSKCYRVIEIQLR